MPSLRSKWPSHAALAAGLIASLLGAVTLAAWQLHFPLLVQVRPTLVPMHRMTAVAVIWAGLALVFAALIHKRAAALCAFFSLAIAAPTLAEYVFSANFGIDLLLGPDYINVHTSNPGRMSPASAVCLIGYGLAIIALSSSSLARWTSAIEGIAGSALVAVGAVNAGADLFLHREVFAWGEVTRLSILSSVCYALLGCGLLALSGQERRDPVSGWMPVAVGLSATAGVVGFWQAIIEHNAGDWLLISSVILAGGLLMALLLAVAVDQTQRARSHNEALRQSEERFREIVEQSPIGIAVVGRDFRLIKTNAAYARMLGYTEAELATMTPIDVTHPDDREMTQEVLQNFFKTDTHNQRLEKRYVTKDGQTIWVAITNSSVHDLHGKPLYSIAMVEDITDRKRAEEESRTLTQRLSLATRSASMGVWEWNLSTNLSIWDDMMFQIFGIPQQAGVPRQEWVRMLHPEDKAKVKTFSYRIFYDKAQDEVTFRIFRPDGALRYVSSLGGPILDERGNVTGMCGIAVDITERKLEEERLRALNTRFAQVAQFASMAVWEFDPRTELFVWDHTAFAITGLPKTDFFRYEAWEQAIHPDDRAANRDAMERIIRSKTQESLEFRFYRPDGTLGYLYAAGGPVLDNKGEVVRVVGIAVDITERKLEEERLRALSTRFAQAIQFASMAVWEFNPSTELFVWDDTAFAMIGLPKIDFVPFKTWEQAIHPDDRAANRDAMERIIRSKTQVSMEVRFYRTDGTLRYLYAAGGPVLDGGQVIRVVGIAIDITERKQEEERLRALSTRFAQATQLASMAVWEWNPRTRTHTWDDTGFTMAGIPKADSIPHEIWARTVHPDDLAEAEAALERIARSKTQESLEFRTFRPDGELRHIYASGGPVLDDKGEVVRAVGIALDVTERRRLEAELEATREQAATSARLSSLGVMAGGVAHEINNPLSIIHALASDLEEMATEGSALPEVVARKSALIRKTAERIARIVKSLRQISREGSSDTFQPTPVAKILAETLEICQAKFAANGVDLLLPQPIPELSILCREVQIAQVLLNLLQNAFDAVLEQEGNRWVRLDVEARDSSVIIAVVDSGPGIPSELRARIMEPFFTTKPIGKGTGLGLSLSKTIAEDHGGDLEYSEDGGHTRFALILPRTRKAEAA